EEPALSTVAVGSELQAGGCGYAAVGAAYTAGPCFADSRPPVMAAALTTAAPPTTAAPRTTVRRLASSIVVFSSSVPAHGPAAGGGPVAVPQQWSAFRRPRC